MSNQIYSNLDTRERYTEGKERFELQVNADIALPTTVGVTETTIPYSTTEAFNTGYIAWDDINKWVVIQEAGIYNITATTCVAGNAISDQALETNFIIDSGALPVFGLEQRDRNYNTVLGDYAWSLTSTYTFKAEVGTTIRTVFRQQEAVTIQGVGHGIAKRTTLFCNKLG